MLQVPAFWLQVLGIALGMAEEIPNERNQEIRTLLSVRFGYKSLKNLANVPMK